MSLRVASYNDVIRCRTFWFLMSAVLAADAFFARIVPYRTIVSVAVPPEYARAAAVRAAVGVGAAQQSTHGEDATSKDASSSPAPCANCIGLASSNAYLNLSHPLGVVMVRRERGFPYEGVARRVAREAASLGGVLVTPTTSSNRARVTLEDAQAIAEALRKANSALVDVPFGYWDGEDTESWRDLTATEAAADGHPAAAVRSAERLQSFLESTQGALNTFG